MRGSVSVSAGVSSSMHVRIGVRDLIFVNMAVNGV